MFWIKLSLHKPCIYNVYFQDVGMEEQARLDVKLNQSLCSALKRMLTSILLAICELQCPIMIKKYPQMAERLY